MSKGKQVKLQRSIGLFEATLCGVGIVLGAGIYVLVGKAAGLAGNAVWISFILAALVSLFTGLSYSELSSMFPRAGAEYVYTENAFGRHAAFLVGFLLVSGITIASSAVSLGFAGYFNAIFHTPIIPTAIALILACTAILLYGVKQSAGLGALFTLVEATGLFIIIAIGLPHLGSINFMIMPFGIKGVFSAAALIFFAYIGFEEIVNMAEEVKNPTRNIPLAVLLSIAITTVIYVLVALAAVSVLGWQELGASTSPLADVAAVVFGQKIFTIIAVIALFSTSNTVLLILLANSRLAYGMARDGSFPKIFSWIHPRRKTPWATILAISGFSILFLFFGGLEAIADLTNLAIFITFIIINGSVIMLRFTHPNASRPFKIPLSVGRLPLVPVFGLLINLFMISYIELKVLIYGFIFLIFAFLLYEVMSRLKMVR